MKRLFLILLVGIGLLSSVADAKTVSFKIIQTTDVHGNYFPYNFITRQKDKGSLARVYSYVKEQRKEYGDRLILLDNGDILQGQPSAYYYNYMDTVAPHLCADIMNYMGYNASTMGNHDVETGHSVYDRWIKQCKFPVMGANIINVAKNEPYLPPYTVFERDSVKIVVMGMITSAIPMWLSENLWSGLHFDDMVETAKKWVPIIKEKEKPDILIGMFHSGANATNTVGYNENASLTVAKEVPGFDVVLLGHDHQSNVEIVKNTEGSGVLTLDPGYSANNIADIDITVTFDDKGEISNKKYDGKLTDTNTFEPDAEFMAHFNPQYQIVSDFVSAKVGSVDRDLHASESFFGESLFMDLIHKLQLDISKADVSFAAPLSMNAKIKNGDIFVSDMFNLYKYENMLYVMNMTGKEIKDYLEMSYDLWVNQMTSPDDHLLLLSQKESKNGSEKGRTVFKNRSYNFDSAAGIKYTVDVTKPKGERVEIAKMANGKKFDLNKTYKVAVNSYRGNGGGELLTKGAGIPSDQLASRIVFSTDKDLRYYLMQYIKKKGNIKVKPLNNWKFVPEKWTKPAADRDRLLIFGR